MTIMEKVVTVAVTNLLLLIVCLLIASGKLDNVFTIAYGKSPLQKSKINFKDFRRRAIIVIAAMDIFISLMVFFPGLAP